MPRIRRLTVTLTLLFGLTVSAAPGHSSAATVTSPAPPGAPAAGRPAALGPSAAPSPWASPRALPPARTAAPALPGAALGRLHAAANPAPPVQRTTGTAAVALTFDDGPDPRWTPQV